MNKFLNYILTSISLAALFTAGYSYGMQLEPDILEQMEARLKVLQDEEQLYHKESQRALTGSGDAFVQQLAYKLESSKAQADRLMEIVEIKALLDTIKQQPADVVSAPKDRSAQEPDKSPLAKRPSAPKAHAPTPSPSPAVSYAQAATQSQQPQQSVSVKKKSRPHYVLDLSSRSRNAAADLRQIEEPFYKHWESYIDRYYETAKAGDKEALKDCTLARDAVIASKHLLSRKKPDGSRYPDRRKTIEDAKLLHVKLMSTKFTTIGALDRHLLSEINTHVYAGVKFKDVPTITFSELNTLHESQRPTAAYKMLQHAFFAYENTLSENKALSLERLNELAEKAISFFYAQRIFLNLKNNRLNPYISMYATPENLDKRLAAHYRLDQELRSQKISLSEFTDYCYYRAYQKLTSESKKLPLQSMTTPAPTPEPSGHQPTPARTSEKHRSIREQYKAQRAAEQETGSTAQVPPVVAQSSPMDLKHSPSSLPSTSHRSKEVIPHQAPKQESSTLHADSDSDDDIRSEKWREFREQYVRSYHSSPSGQVPVHELEDHQKTTSKTSQETSQNHTAEHTTTAVTKQSAQDAKEKQRNAENQKLLRLNRIKALVEAMPNIDTEFVYDTYLNFKNIILKNRYENCQTAADFLDAAKFPIRRAIFRGIDPTQFIKEIKGTDDKGKKSLEWELFQKMYRLLSPIPEYSSLIGLSPEDMIRNLFRIAHTQPMTI